MKIKLLTGRAGANFSDPPGAEIDLPDEEAQRYLDSEQAVLVETAKRKPATNRKRNIQKESR